MNLYHVKINRNEDALRLHAELIMTESCDSAVNGAWEHFLADIKKEARDSLTRGDVTFIVETVKDVTALGENHSVYYTNDILK